jgi:hypothetical protein
MVLNVMTRVQRLLDQECDPEARRAFRMVLQEIDDILDQEARDMAGTPAPGAAAIVN